MKRAMLAPSRIRPRTDYLQLLLPLAIPLLAVNFLTCQVSASQHAHALEKNTLDRKIVTVAMSVEPPLKSISLRHKCLSKIESVMSLNP